MRELVLSRKGRFRFGLSLDRPQASIDELPWQDLVDVFGSGGLLFDQTIVGDRLNISPTYLGFARQLYKASPPVFALIANRMALFQEPRMVFARTLPSGGRGDYFTSAELKPLQEPWSGCTTRDLLTVAEMFNSLAGNAFFALRNGYLRPMRPDWTSIILGSDQEPGVEWYDLDAEVIGYLYHPLSNTAGGAGEPEPLLPSEVIHWKPIPDPELPWRGMSWLTPILEDALSDEEMTAHKRKFLQGGATPNLAVTLDPEKLGITSKEEFTAWVKAFAEEREKSRGNPYKTLFLLGGADPKPIGSDLKNMDFSKVQSIGEVRMAAAAMVHPALAGFTEGLQGSALNAGNLKELFRQFASSTMRPLWGSFCGAAGRVIKPPTNGGPAELWFDDSQVTALKEDIQDLAQAQQMQAATISTLIMAGWDPDSVVDAIVSGDLRRLKHTGLPSVQLQPAPANTNGNASADAAAAAIT